MSEHIRVGFCRADVDLEKAISRLGCWSTKHSKIVMYINKLCSQREPGDSKKSCYLTYLLWDAESMVTSNQGFRIKMFLVLFLLWSLQMSSEELLLKRSTISRHLTNDSSCSVFEACADRSFLYCLSFRAIDLPVVHSCGRILTYLIQYLTFLIQWSNTTLWIFT